MSISPGDLLALLERQGYRCALTGEVLTPENAVPDHKMPVSKGGTNTIENIQLVTQKANRAKADLTEEEFRSLCESVVARTASASESAGRSASTGAAA